MTRAGPKGPGSDKSSLAPFPLSLAGPFPWPLSLGPLSLSVELQGVWDEMFMIDLYAENRERFGINMTAIVEMIVDRYPPSQFRRTLKQQGIN
jgi:hypothetical protein